MNADFLDGQILGWLEMNCRPDDYGILGERMTVIRRAARWPLVIVPFASRPALTDVEFRACAALRRAGVPVILVRSLGEARLAIEAALEQLGRHRYKTSPRRFRILSAVMGVISMPPSGWMTH